MSNKIAAVTSATGHQGASISDALVAAGWRVRGLSRDADWVRREAGGAVERRLVREYEPQALEAAFRGCRAVVLNAPVDYRPGVREGLAQAVREAAEQAGVERVVLNTGAEAYQGYERRISASLFAMRDILGGGRFRLTVVQPTVFMENLLAPPIKAAILEGRLLYPVPPDARIAWLSHRWLGALVVAAAERAEAGAVLRVGGPEALTAGEVADVLAERLGRPVRHEPLSADRFAEMLPAGIGEQVADYYRRLDAYPDALARNDGNEALGVRPESFRAWTLRQDWR